jgi:hypothetical protein
MIASLQILQSIGKAIGPYSEPLLFLFVAVLLIVFLYRLLVTHFGPADLTGTGIAVGAAKIFDNRSLSLMMEGLNTNLQGFNVVTQAATPSASTFQQGDVNSSSNSLQVNAHVPSPSAVTGSSNSSNASDSGSSSSVPSAASEKQAVGSQFGFLPNPGIGAQDVLVDQLNLAYQIFNQRIVNERAISDRIFGDKLRRQVVLGFPVSIDPPDGSENCAAVAEVGLEFGDSKYAISIVALIPQEKTYNVASYSSSANSIDGSIVSVVKSVSGSSSRRSDHLYLHRDADTIAFERDPSKESGAFGLRTPKTKLPHPQTVFGWEFHPVLGRRTVSPGTRLMLAVVALPCPEEEPASSKEKSANSGEKPAKSEMELLKFVVKTRAYWLTYNRKCQTTNVRWAWWPFPGRQGRVPGWTERTIELFSGEQTAALNPVIEKISWVGTGGDQAVVLVDGRNFFAGTEVIIGGKVHNEKNGGVVLKSDRAFQVITKIEALGLGDAVLNGRYGQSKALVHPPMSPSQEMVITPYYQILLESVELQPIYVLLSCADGKPFLLETLRQLPDPIISVNNKPLARPYKFEPVSFEPLSKRGSPGALAPVDKDHPPVSVLVTAWAASDSLAKGAVLLFKIPFCGREWATRTVLSSSEFLLRPDMEVTWGGSKGEDADLVVTGKANIGDKRLLAHFDKPYELTRMDARSFTLTVPRAVLSSYPRFTLVRDDGSRLVLDVPQFRDPGPQAPAGTPPMPVQTIIAP